MTQSSLGLQGKVSRCPERTMTRLTLFWLRTKKIMLLRKRTGMSTRRRPTQFRPVFFVWCVGGQLRKAMCLHGPTVFCSGTLWPGRVILMPSAFTMWSVGFPIHSRSNLTAPSATILASLLLKKNVYANPLNPELCPWLAFAVHIGFNAEHLEKSERLFVKPGAKCGAGSQRYCWQLAEMFKRHSEVVRRYVPLSHANVHGVRKVRTCTYVLKCIFLTLFIYMI